MPSKVTCFNYAKGFYRINISGKVIINSHSSGNPTKVGIDFSYLLKCLGLEYEKIIKPIVSGTVEVSNAHGVHLVASGNQFLGLEMADDNDSGRAGYLLIRAYDVAVDGTVTSNFIGAGHAFYAVGNSINCSFDVVEE